MHLIAQLLPGFAYNCPTVTTQFVHDIRLRYYLIPVQFILNNTYCDNVAHTFFITALSVVRRVACSMLLQIACHWMRHNYQNHSLPLIGWHRLPLILFSHQPRPVHWTCSVATWIVGLSGTNDSRDSWTVQNCRKEPWETTWMWQQNWFTQWG